MAELAAHSRLEAMVGAIVERVQPELVLLFGSRANGKFRPDSDYDLMVVVRDGADAEADRAAAYDASHAAGYSADVLARSVVDYGWRSGTWRDLLPRARLRRKLLKAWIISRGNHPPRTHELPELVSLLPAERRSDPRLTEACALLQKLYPKSRYPEHPLPTPAEAQAALDAAASVRERLLPGLAPATHVPGRTA